MFESMLLREMVFPCCGTPNVASLDYKLCKCMASSNGHLHLYIFQIAAAITTTTVTISIANEKMSENIYFYYSRT